MDIQILTTRNDIFGDFDNIEISSFLSPKALDAFDINIIDLDDPELWKFTFLGSYTIIRAGEFDSLARIIAESYKSIIIIVLPQNEIYTARYTYKNGVLDYKNGEIIPIKDIISVIEEKVLSSLLLQTIKDALLYENNTTILGQYEYTSAFDFKQNNQYVSASNVLTEAYKAQKVTSIRNDRFVLTTLDILKSKDGLMAFLQHCKLIDVRQVDIDKTRYPELIINLAKNTEFLSRADVIQLLHVSPSKAYTLLKKLVAQGVLEPVNKGHYAKYRYVGNR